MDASQYKDYVLFMLFIKYISDKYGDSDDFAPPVTIPKGASFRDMIALKGKSDIGDKINTQIIAPLVDANARLSKTDFPDFNDPNKLGEGKDMVDGEEGYLGALDKTAKAEVNARLKEIKTDKEAKDELAVLKRWLALAESETALKRAVKEQEAALDTLAYEQYPKLTEAEIKTLVLDDKWMTRLHAAVQGELDRVSQTLTGRIRELAERYATPLPQLEREVATLAARVDGHLKRMGF